MADDIQKRFIEIMERHGIKYPWVEYPSQIESEILSDLSRLDITNDFRNPISSFQIFFRSILPLIVWSNNNKKNKESNPFIDLSYQDRAFIQSTFKISENYKAIYLATPAADSLEKLISYIAGIFAINTQYKVGVFDMSEIASLCLRFNSHEEDPLEYHRNFALLCIRNPLQHSKDINKIIGNLTNFFQSMRRMGRIVLFADTIDIIGTDQAKLKETWTSPIDIMHMIMQKINFSPWAKGGVGLFLGNDVYRIVGSLSAIQGLNGGAHVRR